MIDLTYLKSMSEGNDDLVKEMIEIFKQQIPEFSSLMTKYLDNKDWDSLAAVAHKAKSSVYIMGMKELADKLKELETLAKKNERMDVYAEYVDFFQYSCTTAIVELENLYP